MPEFYMILARKILSKYPKFYYTCPKNSQYSRILHDFVRKMPEFYIIIARKIFSRFFFLGGGARALPAPVSYAYVGKPQCIWHHELVTWYMILLAIYSVYKSKVDDIFG